MGRPRCSWWATRASALGDLFSGLTATEQRIAALAVAGNTNRVIADTLVVSVKTVEWNLTKVYEKVGVHSRAELAARVGDASPTGEAALVSEAVTQQASARLN